MKKSLYTIVFTLILSLSFTEAWAGNDNESDKAKSQTYYINAPSFVRPLIEKWITEYKRIKPEDDFAIAKSATNKAISSINIEISDSKVENANNKTVYIAKYAILPIIAKGSAAYQIIGKKEFNEKKLKNLFFTGDNVDENKDKVTDHVVVYSGYSNTSVAIPFASYYGENVTNIRGKGIAGDDIFLNTAIEKDPYGISFNAVPNIYDIQSRLIKNNLDIIHLDFSKEQENAFSSLDKLITSLEISNIKGIPVEKVGFTYNKHNNIIDDFVSWILTIGKNYNHQYGFLELNTKDVAQETTNINSAIIANK